MAVVEISLLLSECLSGLYWYCRISLYSCWSLEKWNDDDDGGQAI